jgi:maleamate amidohydrolase
MYSLRRSEVAKPDMTDRFEDHCWKDVVPADILELYKHYSRDVHIGKAQALIAIDLYEVVYQGGPLPIPEVTKTYASSCGIHAWNAIEPTQRLFAAARRAGLPVFYTTSETRPDARPVTMTTTKRRETRPDPKLYEIRPEFAPQRGDTVVRKSRASAFFGTPIVAHLTQLGIQTVIMCGESTSGCLRASAVDAYSYGFHVVIVEECCFDRNILSHKINLFDLHHKYADVIGVDAVVNDLKKLEPRKAG